MKNRYFLKDIFVVSTKPEFFLCLIVYSSSDLTSSAELLQVAEQTVGFEIICLVSRTQAKTREKFLLQSWYADVNNITLSDVDSAVNLKFLFQELSTSI